MTEAFGTGFVRDEYGRLVLSPAGAKEGWVTGFVRDEYGRLVVVGPEGSPIAESTSFPLAQYGAKGDGITDDSTSLRKAFAAAIKVAETGVTAIVSGRPGAIYKLSTGINSGGGIELPRNLTGRLVFRGEGCEIKLTAECRRLFDMVRKGETKHDVVRNFEAQNFTLNAAKTVSSTPNTEHTLFGNFINGEIAKYLSAENIVLREILVKEIFTGTEAEGAKKGCVLVRIKQDAKKAEEATQDYAKNILIENVKAEGGLGGFDVGGEVKEGGGIPNVLVDEITFRRLWHRVAAEPINNTKYSSFNYEIGDDCIGGRCLIEDCYGAMSQDVGIEIDAMTYAVVQNCLIEDSKNGAFFTASQGEPSIPNARRTIFKNCLAVRSQRPETRGFNTGTGDGTGEVLGSVYYDSCMFYSKNPTPITLRGDGWNFEGPLVSASISHCRAVVESINYETPATAVNTIMVNVNPSSETSSLIVKDLLSSYAGKRSAGAGTLKTTHMRVNGKTMFLDIDDLRFSSSITEATAGSEYLQLGPAAAETHTMRGTLGKVVVLANGADTNPKTIQVSEKVEVDGELTIRDADVRKQTAGKLLAFDAGVSEANKAKIKQRDCKYTTLPVAPEGITVGESPFTYRNLDGYIERVIVRIGTVTKIEISNNNETFEEAGIIAGVFILDHGDSIRVTYAVKPTMRKVPLR